MAQPWELVVAILIRKCQRPGRIGGLMTRRRREEKKKETEKAQEKP